MELATRLPGLAALVPVAPPGAFAGEDVTSPQPSHSECGLGEIDIGRLTKGR